MAKVYIKTFGCQMNEYDSDKMADVLRASHGMQATDNPDDADVILFNTCSVREKAQEKVFHDLGRVKQFKRDNPHVLIGVGGCVASQEGASIVARAPYVDMVFGPQTLHRLPQLIDARAQDRQAAGRYFVSRSRKIRSSAAGTRRRRHSFRLDHGRMQQILHVFAWCPTPAAKKYRARLTTCSTEVAELAIQGVKEITLLGQNVNAYRGAHAEGETADFALLLEYVAEIPGIERIRYTTSHPKEFTQRLIDAYAKIPKLVNHVHLPVQSGSDRVLASDKKSHVRGIRKCEGVPKSAAPSRDPAPAAWQP